MFLIIYDNQYIINNYSNKLSTYPSNNHMLTLQCKVQIYISWCSLRAPWCILSSFLCYHHSLKLDVDIEIHNGHGVPMPYSHSKASFMYTNKGNG